jgi:hypothetical protein
MDAESTVLAYYEALRNGDPLPPFFSRTETTVKFGIGERLTGYEEIRAGLSAQTEATTAWQIDSDRLVVVEESDHAWFSDDVFMAWTDEEADIRYEFETRWSGTLQRQPNEPWDGIGTATPWRFVGMHVSTPGGT